MKQKLTTAFALILLGCSIYSLKAQHAIGLGAGNHNAPYAAFQNPANTYSDYNRLYLNLWGVNMGFTNNFLTYNAPFGLIRMAQGVYPDPYSTPANKLAFDQNWIQINAKDKNKLYYLNEVFGPSAFFRTTRSTAIGFGVNAISGLSADGIGPEAAQMLRYGMDSNSLAFTGPDALQKGVLYKNGPFGINTDAYQEWYFSLAGVTRDKGPHFVKWGGTAKFLVGTGAAGIKGKSLDFSADNNNFNFATVGAAFYHTDDASASTTLADPFGLNFNFIQGAGAGMDMGFVYEYRPDSKRKTVRDWWNCYDETRNGYAWKFGAAINNLGFISYDGVKHSINNSANKTWAINTGVLNNYSYLQGDDRFAKVGNGFFNDSGVVADFDNQFAVSTPVTFNATLDLNAGGNFNVGINWQQSLKGANSPGLKKASYIGVTPRWETEHAEIGMPITLTRDYTALNVGLYGRLGPVIVGTDNLAGLATFASNGNHRAANLYFGVRFQIPACGWAVWETDTIMADTQYVHDTADFWKHDTIIKERVIRDTVRIEKRDTIRIEKRDTVVQYRKLEADPNGAMKAAELKLKEDELKKKEEDLKKRELAVAEKEKTSTADCSERIKVLEADLKRERELYAKLSTLYQESNTDRERQRKLIEELEKEIVVLRNENSGLKTEVMSNQAEILKLKQEIARLKATNKPANAEVKSLDSLLALAEAKVLVLEKENSKKTAEVTAANKTSEDQKKRIAELEAEIAKLKANCTDKAACDAQIKDLQDKLAAEKAKTTGLEKDLTDAKAKVDAASKRIAELEEALKNCGDSDEAAKLKAEIEALKKQNAEKDVLISGLKTEKAKLESDLSDAKSKIADLEKQLSDCKEKDCSDIEEELAQYKAKYQDEVNRYSVLYEEYNAIVSERNTLKSKVADLENKLKDCSGNSDDNAELKAEIAKLKNTITELNGQLDGKQKSLDALQEDYNKVVTEKGNLQKQVNTLQSEVTTLQSKVADLEAKLKECENKIGG